MPPSPQTEIKNLAHAMVKLYIDARIKKIEEHNAHVLECVQQDTMDLREATRGWGLVVCPECMEDVPWGSLCFIELDYVKTVEFDLKMMEFY